MLTVSVSKWGNSKWIKLPKSVTESLEIQDNDSLNVEIKGEAMNLTKLKKK